MMRDAPAKSSSSAAASALRTGNIVRAIEDNQRMSSNDFQPTGNAHLCESLAHDVVIERGAEESFRCRERDRGVFTLVRPNIGMINVVVSNRPAFARVTRDHQRANFESTQANSIACFAKAPRHCLRAACGKDLHHDLRIVARRR